MPPPKSWAECYAKANESRNLCDRAATKSLQKLPKGSGKFLQTPRLFPVFSENPQSLQSLPAGVAKSAAQVCNASR
jgi:hypothetical protein